jgi:ribose transport system substrate-binding protein
LGAAASAIGLMALAALPNAVSAQEQKRTIVLFVKNVTNPFWKSVREGAERAAAEAGNITMTVAAPTKPDNIEEQMRLVEDWITKKPDGMVFVPVDYKAMVPAVQKINEAGIPIVIYNNKMSGAKQITFVGLNDDDIGYEISKHLFKSLGGKGKVIHIDGVPAAITAQDRKKGFDRALKEFPGIEVLASQPANYRRLPAVQVFENLMQRFPQIDGVMAANDDMAIGVAEAAASAGRGSQIKIVGVDVIPDAIPAIAEGRLLASADTSPYDQGYFAMKAMIESLKGGKVPSADLMLPIRVADQTNIKNYSIPPSQRPAPDWKALIAR